MVSINEEESAGASALPGVRMGRINSRRLPPLRRRAACPSLLRWTDCPLAKPVARPVPSRRSPTGSWAWVYYLLRQVRPWYFPPLIPLPREEFQAQGSSCKSAWSSGVRSIATETLGSYSKGRMGLWSCRDGSMALG